MTTAKPETRANTVAAREYPSLHNIPAVGVSVIIQRDGVDVARVDGGNAAFVWIARHTHSSVTYALTWGGYTCRIEGPYTVVVVRTRHGNFHSTEEYVFPIPFPVTDAIRQILPSMVHPASYDVDNADHARLITSLCHGLPGTLGHATFTVETRVGGPCNEHADT